ncbi:hypothetical protein KBZ15_03255 [Cyanobium sp. BA20m-p-22]|uniref:hypothetical protein n=1 Tax=Cyanobium sp. BA20m-p-22 TaxID=2823704 RepID=UPI0020CDADFE|nr:hypothetical protein [Cyanobium sp. BA20m-p-22]MCP9908935.1 hypothetical protein [Cyanobium sp. BA20m-p-22]
MPNDFSAIDLSTINVAHDVIVSAIRQKVCQWEQESSDLATDGNLTNAVMVKHWAFCADILASSVSTEFTNLFSQALNARFGDLTPTAHRSTADQVLDAVALEVVATQGAPKLVTT